MTRCRVRMTGRREGGSYYSLPHAVMQSPNYLALSAHAVKLLNDLGLQYRGSNNGDLSAAWKIMQPRRWRSRDTLCRALAELLHYGLIEKTRQGGLNHCSLYALTWCAIDECSGKLEVPATTVASGRWKIAQPPMPRPVRKNAAPNTVGVLVRHGGRVNPTRQAC